MSRMLSGLGTATGLLVAIPALLTCQAVAPAPDALVPSDPALRNAVEESRSLIQQRLSEGLPGFSVAVAIDGDPVWVEAFGLADLEEAVPVTPETRFRIGSTSKAITAVLAGRLVDRGLVSLDDDVRSIFPDFPEKRWTMTLRDLLSNQAGIRHYGGFESRNSRHFESVADGLQMFAGDTLMFEPHSYVSYSSYGFNLAGAALAYAAGLSFADLAARELFEPLGMTHSTVDDPTVDIPSRAVFYTDDQALAAQVDDSYKAPSGGLLSTPTDLVRFGSAVIGQLELPTGPLLSTAMTTELTTPRPIADGRQTGYALGLRIQEPDPDADPAVPLAWHHGGSSVGGRSMLLMLPEQGIVVSLLTNTDAYDTKERDAAEIARSFATALGR